MNLFETTAYAAPAGPGGDTGLINILFLGGFVLIFYFLLIRPQNKRRKEHQALDRDSRWRCRTDQQSRR